MQRELQELRSKLKEKSDQFNEAAKERDDLSSQLELAQKEQRRLSMEALRVKKEFEAETRKEFQEMLEGLRSRLKAKSDEFCEAIKEKDDLWLELQLAQNEQRRLSMEAQSAKDEVENIEYKRQEEASELGAKLAMLQNEKTTLESELEELTKKYKNLSETKAASSDRERSDYNISDSKKKVGQLDKNLETLTVMYHKVVAQNSGLKVEVAESDRKIERKDLRIQKLESNLREAKEKYEKLLTQCTNLTAMIDARGRRNPGRGASATPNATSGSLSEQVDSPKASSGTSSPVSLRGGTKSRAKAPVYDPPSR